VCSAKVSDLAVLATAGLLHGLFRPANFEKIAQLIQELA
jgi:hypothetical protein